MLRIFNKKTTERSDQELVSNYQKTGNVEILGELYERYIPLVYGVCLKYLGKEAEAEDAVMSIFEELIKKVRQHEIRQFRGWLHVLTRNHCLMKKRSNGKIKVVPFDATFMQIPDKMHPIDEAEESRLEGLQPCMDKLPDSQRKCVEMFYYQGKSYREIAELIDEELGRVRSHIQNGRRNLKICLEQKNEKSIRK